MAYIGACAVESISKLGSREKHIHDGWSIAVGEKTAGVMVLVHWRTGHPCSCGDLAPSWRLKIRDHFVTIAVGS